VAGSTAGLVPGRTILARDPRALQVDFRADIKSFSRSVTELTWLDTKRQKTQIASIPVALIPEATRPWNPLRNTRDSMAR